MEPFDPERTYVGEESEAPRATSRALDYVYRWFGDAQDELGSDAAAVREALLALDPSRCPPSAVLSALVATRPGTCTEERRTLCERAREAWRAKGEPEERVSRLLRGLEPTPENDQMRGGAARLLATVGVKL